MRKIRFAIAQMNPTVGDYAGNTQTILAWIRKAEKKKADLLVFPECALSGYPVWDLANKKRFVDEGLKHLKRIAGVTRRMKLTVVLGFIDRGEGRDGRSLNALAWIEKGKVRTTYAKQLLPTYDVFLEEIFFAPGEPHEPIEWKNFRVGPTICEDLWDEGYKKKPIRDLKRQKADLIINISASPYFRGSTLTRDVLLKKHAVRNKLPILYVNQVGGQDDLIFDGRSFFVGPQGKVLFRAPAFEENLFFFDWDPKNKKPYAVPLAPYTSQPEEVYNGLVLGMRDYCRKNGFKKAIIGIVHDSSPISP